MREGASGCLDFDPRLPSDTIKEFDSGAQGEKKAGSRQLEVERNLAHNKALLARSGGRFCRRR
jgi:hypothetical protein